MYFEVVSILKAKAKGLGVVPSSTLDANDVAASELYWVRTCQEALFQDKKFEVDRKLQFGLFSDSAGVWSIWRCRGRLENVDLPARTKHPILLPGGHHFTSLQVLDCHRRVMHGGVKETLTTSSDAVLDCEGEKCREEFVASVPNLYKVQWVTIRCS